MNKLSCFGAICLGLVVNGCFSDGKYYAEPPRQEVYFTESEWASVDQKQQAERQQMQSNPNPNPNPTSTSTGGCSTGSTDDECFPPCPSGMLDCGIVMGKRLCYSANSTACPAID